MAKLLDYDGFNIAVNKVMDLINGGGSSDFIIEEGTNSIWTYKKWASGLAECFGTYSKNSVVCNSPWGSLYEAKITDPIALPSGLFTSILSFNCNLSGVAVMLETMYSCTTTQTPMLYAVRPTVNENAGTVNASMHIIGRWKDFTPSSSQSRYTPALIFRGRTNSSMHMDTMTESGIWTTGSADTLPGGLNNIFTWSFIIVLADPTSNMVHEYLFRPASGGNNSFLMREFSGNPGAWCAWKYASVENW